MKSLFIQYLVTYKLGLESNAFGTICGNLWTIDIINNRLGIEGLDFQILCSRITRPLSRKEKDFVTGTNNIKKSCACASFFSASCTLYIPNESLVFGCLQNANRRFEI